MCLSDRGETQGSDDDDDDMFFDSPKDLSFVFSVTEGVLRNRVDREYCRRSISQEIQE
jgi:hypothetical protein